MYNAQFQKPVITSRLNVSLHTMKATRLGWGPLARNGYWMNSKVTF